MHFIARPHLCSSSLWRPPWALFLIITDAAAAATAATATGAAAAADASSGGTAPAGRLPTTRSAREVNKIRPM